MVSRLCVALCLHSSMSAQSPVHRCVNAAFSLQLSRAEAQLATSKPGKPTLAGPSQVLGPFLKEPFNQCTPIRELRVWQIK